MEKIKIFAKKIYDFIKFTGEKNISTLSGALAFFLWTGVVPFFFLILYFLSLFGIEEQNFAIILQGLFGSLSEDVAAAAFERKGTIFFIVISLYSSSHFFYHLTKAGINIYGEQIFEKSHKKRVFSFLYMFIIALIMLGVLVIDFVGKSIFDFLNFNEMLSALLDIIAKMLLNLLLCGAIHRFAAPDNISNYRLIIGFFLTFCLWEIIGLGYYIYLNITEAANSSSYIVRGLLFTLYLYLMMQSLCYGIALNSYLIKKYKDNDGENADKVEFRGEVKKDKKHKISVETHSKD